MNPDARHALEKLALELKVLRAEDLGLLAVLGLNIQSVLWPKESVDPSLRSMQFMTFEIQKASEGKSEAERWDILRRFIFEEKEFLLSSARPSEVTIPQILVKNTIEERSGHPLPILFLILHFSYVLEIPLCLIQARHHFLLKWVRTGGKTSYLDLYNSCHALTDHELVQVLNRSSSNLEVWTAKQLVLHYLELLISTLDRHQLLTQLNIAYNLVLQVDETNTVMLGQRALLRHRLGFDREALADLKRYFSFVDRVHAPSALVQAWLELENTSEPPERGPVEFLH